jgi:anaerobic ribonucleoside-triphosphate reductase
LLTIGTTVDPRFYQLLESIPLEIRKIEGIDKIDPFLLANEYMESGNVADVSVDPNANVSGKSPVSMDSEIFKGIKKVRNYFLLWKQLEKNHGLEHANKIMYHIFTSPLYFHDITKIEVPYCFAPDTSFWMTAGRPYGWLPGGAPRKAYSFVGQTVEVAMDFSQENAGAIGLANFLVNLAYCTKLDKQQLAKSAIELQSAFNDGALGATDIAKIIAGFYAHNDEQYNKYVAEIKNDLEADIDVKEILFKYYGKFVQDMLQQFVHVMHNTFRIGGDSPFTNLSLFCEDTIKKTFADAYYPDMSSPADNIDEIMWVQDLYIDFFSKGSPITEKNYRFPVSTVNINTRPLTEEEKKQFPNKKCRITDDKFFEKLARKNARRGVFNWHKGEKIASCCRLTSDLSKLKETIKMDSFGNGGLSIGCYDNETEVLTNNGWRFFKDLDREDKICTLNPNTKEIEYQLPTTYFKSRYSGEMHRYNHESLDFLVTPNHNMAVISRKTKEFSLIQSKDLKSGFNLFRLGAKNKNKEKGNIIVGKSVFESYSFFEFLGFYLGDGSICHDEQEAKKRAYEISFFLKKERKITYIERVLNDLGLEFRKDYIKSRDSFNIHVYNKDIWEYLRLLGKCKEKRIPRDILLSYSSNELKGLFDGLINSDGTIKNGTWLYTSSEQLKNDFEELCILLGFQFHTFYREGEVVIDDRIIESNCYEIKVLMKEREVYKLSKYKEITTYNGNIYCVEVPNHIIAVKRNGTVMWCGNSHRVVTLDLHGIAMEAVKDKKSFFKVLNDFQLFAEQALIAHKQILQDVVDKRLLKFFNIKWANMNMFFSTFGFVGLYDAYKILKSYGVEKRTYVTFAKETLHQLEDYAEYAGMRNPGFAFNVEEVPAETAAIKMAQKDNYLYFNTVNYKRVELLSNQMIPLYVDEFSVDERLSIMGELMNINSGGAICHLNVDSSMTEEVSIELTREMIEDYDIPHFAMNIGTTTCVNCHTTIGIYQECPVCRDKVKTWTTRVVGFNTDTEDWHSVRRNWEMPRRTWYKSDGLL